MFPEIYDFGGHGHLILMRTYEDGDLTARNPMFQVPGPKTDQKNREFENRRGRHGDFMN